MMRNSKSAISELVLVNRELTQALNKIINLKIYISELEERMRDLEEAYGRDCE